MSSERAGYTVSVFAIDVSPPMGEAGDDPGGSSSQRRSKTKLDLAKEYVARRCEPKISSGRKTEAVGILSFGGKTNNEASRAYYAQDPDGGEDAHANVACDVAIQTAKPRALEEVMNLEVGKHEGNPVSALMVALDMIHTHKHSKSWALEVILITDGESAFTQDDYEDAMTRFDELGVKLVVLGIGFQPPDLPVDKSKSRNKRLSEKFWRTFVQLLHERISQTTSSPEMLPTIETFDEALAEVRLPRCAVVNGTVSNITLYIGSALIDLEQAIEIPIKYSKATMKARPPTLSKAWKPALDAQAPGQARGDRTTQFASSQLLSSIVELSQQRGLRASDVAADITADVKHHSTYVIKKPESAVPANTQATQANEMDDAYPTQEMPELGEDEDEEVVAKEDIVKAWRFGSTWVPVEADTFEPLNTQKGVEVLGFFPQENIKRHHLMGEVRFIWPDLSSPKAQIQFSSLVEGMQLREMCAVVRWVLKDSAEPAIGLCVPESNYPGEQKRLDFMFWIQLPFAEDEHNFWFPSLTTYRTAAGKVINEHPLLPTEEQCKLMYDLVEAMDLDAYAAEKAKEQGGEGVGGDGDEEMDEDVKPELTPWFEPIESYNPVIHRIKEAIFHASLAEDLEKDPLGPPHPELTKYFNTPDEILERVDKLTGVLKETLNVKKVPPKVRQKKFKEGLREDEGYIDIDALFDEETEKKEGKGEPSTPKKGVKEEPVSARKAKAGSPEDENKPSRSSAKSHARPKKGRLISNENPLDDFNRLIEGEGDVFRKAIQDLGVVVQENVEASFSRQAFPLAIECLKAMRETALMYEEVETYNTFIDSFEEAVKAEGFKHRDFWNQFEKAGDEVVKITPEEARAKLEEYE